MSTDPPTNTRGAAPRPYKGQAPRLSRANGRSDGGLGPRLTHWQAMPEQTIRDPSKVGQHVSPARHCESSVQPTHANTGKIPNTSSHVRFIPQPLANEDESPHAPT